MSTPTSLLPEYQAWMERVCATYDAITYTCHHRLGDREPSPAQHHGVPARAGGMRTAARNPAARNLFRSRRAVLGRLGCPLIEGGAATMPLGWSEVQRRATSAAHVLKHLGFLE